MTLDEINARLAAISRPTFEAFADALRPDRVRALRLRQNEWDLAHPELAAEHAALMRETDAIQRMESEKALALAEKGRAKANLRAMAGDRVGDALATSTETPALLSARAWWPSTSWCLALIGDLGVGKSVGAGWIALQALEAGKTARWLDARDAAVSPIFGTEGSTRAHRAREVDLLVIDDLGAGAPSEAWKAWVEAILGYRHAREFRTVVTSNANAEKFKALVGERMVDRIREGGVVKDFGGASLRKRTA